MNDDLVSLKKAAGELYRSPNTLRKYAQRGKIPAGKVMGRWYLTKAWVEEQKKTPQEPLWAKLSAQPPSKPKVPYISSVKGKVIGYHRESLEKGTKVFIPPAYSISIPLSVEAGEAITHISVSSVKGWPLDNYVDCSLSTADGREVVNAGRVLNWGATLTLPAGKYYLALGNEFTQVEKQVLVTVKWEPETQPGDNPPAISEFSDLRADFH